MGVVFAFLFLLGGGTGEFCFEGFSSVTWGLLVLVLEPVSGVLGIWGSGVLGVWESGVLGVWG